MTVIARGRRDGYFTLGTRHELLLRAALGGDERSIAAFEELKEGLDVLRIDLAAQRFVPRLLANLERLGADADDPVLEQFRKVTRFTWLKTQFLIANCAPLVAALGEAGIPTMLMKGAAVVHHTGGDVALRPMDDIDIAIPLAALHPAFEVAAEVGFRPVGPALSGEELDVYAGLLHALGTRNGANALADVHWHMLPDGLHPTADQDFWRGSEPALLGTAECSASSREDTIVQAVAHAARPETDASLRWAADVAALVQSAPAEGIDWDKVVVRARRHRLALPTGQALAVVRRVADLAVPPATIDTLLGSRVPLAERIDARPRRRRDGRPRLPNRTEQVVGAYQRFVGRAVAPGSRPSPMTQARFFREWWGLQRLREVPVHAAFVAAGRPWSLSGLVSHRHPAPAPPLDVGHTARFVVGEGGRGYLGVGWSFPEEVGTWTMTREATIRLEIPDRLAPDERLVLRLGLSPQLSRLRPRLEVDVVVNGRRLARWAFVGTTWSPQDREVVLDPADRHASGLLAIRMVIKGPTTPNSVDGGSDSRALGICLGSLSVRRSGAPEAGQPAEETGSPRAAPLHAGTH